VHAIISNIEEERSSQSVVEWYNERCGGGDAEGHGREPVCRYIGILGKPGQAIKVSPDQCASEVGHPCPTMLCAVFSGGATESCTIHSRGANGVGDCVRLTKGSIRRTRTHKTYRWSGKGSITRFGQRNANNGGKKKPKQTKQRLNRRNICDEIG